MTGVSPTGVPPCQIIDIRCFMAVRCLHVALPRQDLEKLLKLYSNPTRQLFDAVAPVVVGKAVHGGTRQPLTFAWALHNTARHLKLDTDVPTQDDIIEALLWASGAEEHVI